MIVAANAPLPPNGLNPLPAVVIARTQAELAWMDVAEKTARAAVLGYCNPTQAEAPVSAAVGVSWIEQHGALAATLFVGGLLVAGAAMGSSKKGR